MPSALGSSIVAWEKALVRYSLSGLTGYLYDLLTSEGPAPVDSEWRRMFFIYQDNQTGAPAADWAYLTFDILNFTGGTVDDSWTTTDYSTIEGLFDTWFNSFLTYTSPTLTMAGYKWYRRRFSPAGITKPFADSGPPVRVTAKTRPGTASTSFLPRQVALSITEKTTWPGHWGRFYVPVGNAGSVSSSGRYSTGMIDAAATATQTLYSSLAAANFNVVVPVTQVDKAPFRGLLNVTSIQVDDIPDVVRRRRLRNPGYRKVLP